MKMLFHALTYITFTLRHFALVISYQSTFCTNTLAGNPMNSWSNINTIHEGPVSHLWHAVRSVSLIQLQ